MINENMVYDKALLMVNKALDGKADFNQVQLQTALKVTELVWVTIHQRRESERMPDVIWSETIENKSEDK